jgi:hypothetical protein
VSGFANTEGGLVIWGVKEEKDASGNTILVPRPIPKITQFMVSLNEEIGRCVSRPVVGVRNEMILLADDTGFALTCVPDSPDKPHMCIVGREYRYYIRTGSSTQKIVSHNHVEALMNHRKFPKLEVFVDQSWMEPSQDGDPNSSHAQYRAFVSVRNVGDVLAKHVAVTLRSYGSRKYTGQLDLRSGSIVHVREDGDVDHHCQQFRTSLECVVYPGMTIHNVEIIQPIRGDIEKEQKIHWRLNADGLNDSGILSLEDSEMRGFRLHWRR